MTVSREANAVLLTFISLSYIDVQKNAQLKKKGEKKINPPQG